MMLTNAHVSPHIIDPSTAEGRAALDQRASQPGVRVVDTIAAQVDDLLLSRSPRLPPTALARARRALVGDRPAHYGRWIYYPWLQALVHTLPPVQFREARLARNQRKITAGEQARLATRMIGIIGLSVGRQIAQTLAMEGVCGGFRLTDGDQLALSNLNRVPASVADLGVSKAVLAARRLFEIDPFLRVEIEPAGLALSAIDDFLRGPDHARPLDLVIEECDDLAVKLGVRARARALGIPVLMETSERGTLDIERYDLEPDRPLLHGLLDAVDVDSLDRPGVKRQAIMNLLPAMRPRTLDSVIQVGTGLRSWPQLASEIALGAATVTTAARLILLNQPVRSGRYHVELDELLARPRQWDMVDHTNPCH